MFAQAVGRTNYINSCNHSDLADELFISEVGSSCVSIRKKISYISATGCFLLFCPYMIRLIRTRWKNANVLNTKVTRGRREHY
jgi:hypothetical protein